MKSSRENQVDAYDSFLTEQEELELLLLDCKSSGHRPHDRIATLGDPVGYFVCRCGKYTWNSKRLY